MSERAEHVAQQRRFYETRAHDHLRVRDDDHYARKLAARLARSLGLGPGDRVLEVGAGFGRFTFRLLPHCGEILAVDLSQRVLDALVAERDARAIAAGRCQVHCADVDALDPRAVGRFDAVVGFFFLHHMPDYGATIGRLAPLLRPAGRMAFLEPNRRNPLYLVQLLACPDMDWREEKGLYRIGPRATDDAYRRARLRPRPVESLGFFPPQIANRSAAARRLERRIEGLGALRWVLPFLILSAEAEASSAEPPAEGGR